METTHKAIEDDCEMGDQLSQKEKELIHKSIDEVEEKILQFKIIIWVLYVSDSNVILLH